MNTIPSTITSAKPMMETPQEVYDIVGQLLNDSTYVTIELPTNLYTELETLAQAEQCSPTDIVAYIVAEHVYQRRSWAENWKDFCGMIQQQNGLDVPDPDDEEEFFAHMRKIRQEVYEEEYAHLYDHLYR